MQSHYMARRSRLRKTQARDPKQQTLTSFQNAPNLDLHSQDDISRPLTQAVNQRNEAGLQGNKMVSEYNSIQQRSLMSFKESKESRIQRMMSQATAGNNFNIKFNQAYRGISKKDIINYSVGEIYNKIQGNINDSIKEIRMEKLKQVKSDLQEAAGLTRMKQEFEAAKQEYLKNKDSQSLSKYTQIQKELWIMEVQ